MMHIIKSLPKFSGYSLPPITITCSVRLSVHQQDYSKTNDQK